MQRPFVVVVTDLLGSTGARRIERLVGPLAYDTNLVTLTGDAVAVITLEAVADGLVARGTVTAPVRFRCNRCLLEWEEERTADVVAAFGAEPDEEIHPIGRDGTIDLEPLLHDELSLSLPLVPLCREGCRGLCPTCGTDLNTEPCSGHADESDSPFAALRDFLHPEAD